MIKNVLTIAGTDPSGGAGICADLKTFSALGTYGMIAITAVVAQNTQGVKSFKAMDPEFVADQIDAVFSDVRVDAVKIGMIANAAIASAVVRELKKHPGVKIVLDPVMVAKSGDLLLEVDAIEAIRSQLIPLATVITPNLPEAAVLLNRQQATTVEEMQEWLPELLKLGSPYVLLKGGAISKQGAVKSVDFLGYEGGVLELSADRIDTTSLHGTGCTLSAALASYITEKDPVESAREAKAYLTDCLRNAKNLTVGKGQGPVHHFCRVWRK